MRQYAVREIRDAFSIWGGVTEESPALAAVVSGCHGDDDVMHSGCGTSVY